MKVMFYVQHLLGIGHLPAPARIAQAMAAQGMAVTMVTGGLPVPGFPAPGIANLTLPPIVAAEGFSGLVDQDGQPIDDAFRARRREAAGGLRPACPRCPADRGPFPLAAVRCALNCCRCWMPPMPGRRGR